MINQVISFSLFGTQPIYLTGALRNAEQYPQKLPGWRCVFYCAPEVSRTLRNKLEKTGAEVRECSTLFANRMFDRLTILDDPKIERTLFRDTDSRPTQREAEAVGEWVKRVEPFHSLADHPCHSLPLGGGLWGVDKTKFKEEVPHVLGHVTEAIVKSRLARKPYTREKGYSLDQAFLTQHIWPVAKRYGVLRHDSCTRDRFVGAEPFLGGAGFDDLRFVGEVISEHEQPHPWHWQMRLNYLKA